MASEHASKGFFVVSHPEFDSAHDTEFLKGEESEYGDAPRCEVCGEYVDGNPWLPPYHVELTLHGSRWGDFAFSGNSQFLVSERFSHIYAENKLSGLSGFEPVEAVSVKGRVRPPLAYLHVTVARNGATLDDARSSIVRPSEPTCEYCLSAGINRISGFSLKEGTWTGADIFEPKGLGGVVVVSARFRDVVEGHGLTNIRFTPIGSYEWDPFAPVFWAAAGTTRPPPARTWATGRRTWPGLVGPWRRTRYCTSGSR